MHRRVVSLLFACLCILATAPIARADADLAIEKVGPAQAAAGSDVTYTITVTNLGPDAATAVTVDDATPAGMTFVSETHDPAFACTTPAVGDPGTVSCTSATLASGASATFTVTFHIDASATPGTTFTNVATVTEPTDPNEENNSSSVPTTTPPPAQSDLAIVKTGPNYAAAESDVTFAITLTNSGPATAAEVQWTDTLPGTMTFVSLTQTSGPALSCVTPSAGTGGTITCSATNYPVGATADFTLVGHIPAGTAGGTSFINSATATNVTTPAGTGDPNPENDVSQTEVIVQTIDVSVTKSGPATVTAGTDVTYTITVANAGPDIATNVVLSDVLPPGTTFVSRSHTTGPTPTCSEPPPGSNGQVTCTWASLAPGSSATESLTINSGSAPSISNTATVTAEGGDTDTSNESSTVATAVTQSADLAVTKSGPATATAGTNITYTIGVSNSGPSNATSVTLTDALPPSTTFVSLTQNSGPTFSCTTPAPSATGTVTCSIATLNSGASATFTVVVQLNSSATNGDTISNTVSVASTTPDPANGNDSATVNTTSQTSADVGVTKSGPATVAPGADITYSVTVSNTGPSDAQSVQLTDALPAGTTFVSGTQNSGPTFTCSYPVAAATGTITCNVASLAAGASANFTFVFHVDPTSTGTISNTATVTSTTSDPNPGNGTATAAPAAVVPGTTDLRITKTANAERLPPRGQVTYTIDVTNDGPAVATNVVVTDVLPAGSTLVSANSTQGSCTGTTTVTCNVGVLLQSASATISLVVTLPPTFGNVDNTATVTSANADSNPANNASTVSLAIASEIPLLSPLTLAFLAIALATAGVFVSRMQ